MNKHILTISAFAAITALIACGGEAKKEEANAVKNTGIDIANIDSTVKPVDDFYQFVNGNCLTNKTKRNY